MNIDYFAEGVDPNAVVRPWEPKVGDRVRVRVVEPQPSEDCQCLTHENDVGSLGTVFKRMAYGESDIWVMLDGPVRICPGCQDDYGASFFTPYELEPL